MAIEIFCPALGEGVNSAQITSILVEAGEAIEIDQPILELETDKASMEVPSTVAGTVTAIHVESGAKIDVGALVMSVEAKEGAAAKPTPTAAAAPAPAEAAKAPKPPRAPAKPASGKPATPLAAAAPACDPAAVPAAPSVRRFAREIGVDVTQAEGTGPGGRITGDDIKALSRQTQATGGPSLPSQPLPDFANWGEIEVEAMSNLRRTAATHLARCWTTVPHVTQFDQADVSDLERYRKSLAKIAEAHGAKLTVTAILVKVVAIALRKFPAFNSSVDMSTQSVIYKKYCNIGIAVDTPRGLIVPVVKNADQLGVLGIAVALTEISARARTGKTPLSDMQGGTFTISNLGGIGGTGFTPIVNWPEVAILGVARSQQQTIWVDGQPQPTTAMPLALSYDHRVIDGADGARFLRWICQALENPLLLSLEG